MFAQSDQSLRIYWGGTNIPNAANFTDIYLLATQELGSNKQNEMCAKKFQGL